MPVSKVQNVALSLNNGNKKCCTKVIGVKELREFCAPVAKIFGNTLGFFRSTADGYWLD